MAHSPIRTSPKGKGMPFVGTCVKCGKDGITFATMGEHCVNPANITSAEALEVVLGISPEKKQ